MVPQIRCYICDISRYQPIFKTLLSTNHLLVPRKANFKGTKSIGLNKYHDIAKRGYLFNNIHSNNRTDRIDTKGTNQQIT